MLHIIGRANTTMVVRRLKEYLPPRGKKDQVFELKYKDNGELRVAVFQWLAGQWIYTESRDVQRKQSG